MARGGGDGTGFLGARVAHAAAVSAGFRGVATRALEQLGRAVQRIG